MFYLLEISKKDLNCSIQDKGTYFGVFFYGDVVSSPQVTFKI